MAALYCKLIVPPHTIPHPLIINPHYPPLVCHLQQLLRDQVNGDTSARIIFMTHFPPPPRNYPFNILILLPPNTEINAILFLLCYIIDWGRGLHYTPHPPSFVVSDYFL